MKTMILAAVAGLVLAACASSHNAEQGGGERIGSGKTTSTTPAPADEPEPE